MSGADTAVTRAGGVRGTAVGLAVVPSFCFGASGSLGKALIGAGFDPLQAVWLRMAGATLVLVPLVLVLRGRRVLAQARRWRGPLLAYGVTGVAGCQALYFVAASRVPVGVAILLEFTGPVLVLAWIRLVRRAPVQRSAVTGVALALAGLALVVQIWSGVGLDPLGLAAGLGAAGCQAAYFLLVERMTDADPLVMTAVGSLVGTLLLSALAAPWAIPWRLLAGPVHLGPHTAPAWLTLAWLVLVSTVIAYVTGITAVQRLSAQVAGAICYAEAVFAPLLAWALLGEHLTAVQIVGGAVILVGAYIAQRAIPPADGTARGVEVLAVQPADGAAPLGACRG